MEAKVYSVEAVHYHVDESNPAMLIVAATGQVNSSGWSVGRLLPWAYIEPPADGILDFDFVASAPPGPVLWVMSPIGGDAHGVLQGWVRGVRVHASSCRVELRFEDRVAPVPCRDAALALA